MSWTSPLTVPITTRPLPPASAFSMCGSRYATAAFIVSALCSTNGSCISPRPNSSPTTFMPSSSTSLTIESAGRDCELLLEVGLEAVALAVDDAVLEALLDRPAGAVLLLDRGGLDALEQRHELGERVVAVAAAVVDEVERDLADVVVDLVHRHDARRVHDGGVEAGLAALVQEHAVEHVADRGLEPEADVREAEDRRRARQLGLDAPDRLDRLHAVAAEVLAGRSRAGT